MLDVIKFENSNYFFVRNYWINCIVVFYVFSDNFGVRVIEFDGEERVNVIDIIF